MYVEIHTFWHRKKEEYSEGLEEADKLFCTKKQAGKVCIPLVLELKRGKYLVR